MLELFDEERPLGTRTDDRHVAAEDVPELRQFVEVEAAQPSAHRRRPRVLVMVPTPDPYVSSASIAHRAELVDGEGLAVQPHAFLAVEDRAG